jgi:hypothetical protein
MVGDNVVFLPAMTLAEVVAMTRAKVTEENFMVFVEYG